MYLYEIAYDCYEPQWQTLAHEKQFSKEEFTAILEDSIENTAFYREYIACRESEYNQLIEYLCEHHSFKKFNHEIKVFFMNHIDERFISNKKDIQWDGNELTYFGNKDKTKKVAF